MGARIGAGFALVITGIIIADILIHPEGTTAAGNAVQAVTVPAYNAVLGVPSNLTGR